jgi:3-hydroxy acid dehydrogenase/malonic semialdehyde reductase
MPKMNVVITGASAGIGAAAARRFAKEGHKVLLVARRRDKLEALCHELKPQDAAFIELDVADRNAVKLAFERIESEFGGVDILVNNAGGAFGLEPAQEASLDDWDTCVDVNIKGLIYCTHCALPGMVERQRGHIINLGSVAGHYPYPGGNVYCGAKAFTHQFSLSLRADLIGTQVRVSCIEPGLTSGTEFSKVRFRGDDAKARKVYENTAPLLPEDIAETIYFCASLPPHVNINTIEMMPTVQAFNPLSVHRF